MADGNTNWNSRSGGQPNRTGLVAGAVVGTILLATIGATAGWLIADAQRDDGPANVAEQTTGPTTAPAPTTARTTKSGPSRPTAKSTTPKLSDGEFLLPNLVGRDFEEARGLLRDRKLGWQIKFGPLGSDRSVASTNPRPNEPVRQGDTVVITVLGAAPVAVVPSLVGSSCHDAKDKLGDVGLYPRYPSGESGPVTRQDPEPQTELHWNDEVRIYCGEETPPTP